MSVNVASQLLLSLVGFRCHHPTDYRLMLLHSSHARIHNCWIADRRRHLMVSVTGVLLDQ